MPAFAYAIKCSHRLNSGQGNNIGQTSDYKHISKVAINAVHVRPCRLPCTSPISMYNLHQTCCDKSQHVSSKACNSDLAHDLLTLARLTLLGFNISLSLLTPQQHVMNVEPLKHTLCSASFASLRMSTLTHTYCKTT